MTPDVLSRPDRFCLCEPTNIYIIGQIGYCIRATLIFISGRGRPVHLFKKGDYRKVELSQPGPLSHIIMLLIKLFRIGPVTGPRLAVLDRGRRPRSNTADFGPVIGPIRNNLINEILIN